MIIVERNIIRKAVMTWKKDLKFKYFLTKNKRN